MEMTLTRNHPAMLMSLDQDMLIGGKRVPAASGERFETRNPATGELLARVARGTAQDVDRAVASARAAFEGPWRRMKAAERQRIMLRLADLVEEHYEELAMLDTLDLGAPVSRTILGKTRRRPAALLCGSGDADRGRYAAQFRAGRCAVADGEGTDGRGRGDQPVERAAPSACPCGRRRPCSPAAAPW
jgi:acyl-CoA reductase-like NAD-dependent aldehyde dehydrogenase